MHNTPDVKIKARRGMYIARDWMDLATIVKAITATLLGYSCLDLDGG